MILTDRELEILRAAMRHYCNNRVKQFSDEELRSLRQKISETLRSLNEEVA